MDAEEVMTGKKKALPEDPIADAIYWHRQKPLSKEELDGMSPRKPSLPALNPQPFIQLVEAPKKHSKKTNKGVMIGLKWSF